MKRIKDEELDSIHGGSDPITGPIITAITGIIKLLQDAGHALGSGIRRIGEDNLCPLE
jgi:hypothetical protein